MYGNNLCPQMSDKENMVYIYNGILFSLRGKWWGELFSECIYIYNKSSCCTFEISYNFIINYTLVTLETR